MKPDTHHCFSTSILVRSLNRVMVGFTLPTDSQARIWQYSTQLTARGDRTRSCSAKALPPASGEAASERWLRH